MKNRKTNALRLTTALLMTSMIALTSCEKEEISVNEEASKATTKETRLNSARTSNDFVPDFYYNPRVGWSKSTNFNFARQYYESGDSFTRVHSFVEGDKSLYITLNQRFWISDIDVNQKLTVEELTINGKVVDLTHPSFNVKFGTPFDGRTAADIQMLGHLTVGSVTGLVFQDGTVVERINSYDIMVKYDVTFPSIPSKNLPSKSESTMINLRGGSDVTSDALSSTAKVLTDENYFTKNPDNHSVSARITKNGKKIEISYISPQKSVSLNIESMSINGKTFNIDQQHFYSYATEDTHTRFEYEVFSELNADGFFTRKVTYSNFILDAQALEILKKVESFKIDFRYRFSDPGLGGGTGINASGVPGREVRNKFTLETRS